MTAPVAVFAFLAGTVVSLITSIVLVARLERVGERLRLSEALLGIVAALAADAPEVSAAVTAVAHHEQRVGAGVILGSNVFNLAALLGLGAVVAGRIALHRKVVLLGGAVALWVAVVCVPVVLGVLPAAAGLALALAVVTGYGLVLGTEGRNLERLAVPRRWSAWLRSAVSEEELELEEAIRPARGRWPDAVAAAAALIVVIVASVTMERAASALGARYAVPEIVVGGLMLAAVTSLPNAVAAVYLAARGRAAATLSTALNSNTLNVLAGLLLPAAVIELGRPSGQAVLVTVWYVALTLAVLALAWRDRGLGRGTGSLVITAYAAFTLSVLVSGYAIPSGARVVTVLAVLIAAGLAAEQLRRKRTRRVAAAGTPPRLPRARGTRWHTPTLRRESLLPGWTVGRLWVVSLTMSGLVASVDAVSGPRIVLIGLLIIGPCGALLTGRRLPTAVAGLWATGLAVVLGLPDGIWGTATHVAFFVAVGLIALITTVAAGVISNARP
jgi:cation:H+ antiporter